MIRTCSKELSIEGLRIGEEKRDLKCMKPGAGLWEVLSFIHQSYDIVMGGCDFP